MSTTKFWITTDQRYGIFNASIDQAFAPDLEYDPPLEFVPPDWRQSTRAELENACLDWRFEDGYWQQ